MIGIQSDVIGLMLRLKHLSVLFFSTTQLFQLLLFPLSEQASLEKILKKKKFKATLATFWKRKPPLTKSSKVGNLWAMDKLNLCLMKMIVIIVTKQSRQTSAQGCIICSILPSGMGARGVSSEHVENMEMYQSDQKRFYQTDAFPRPRQYDVRFMVNVSGQANE